MNKVAQLAFDRWKKSEIEFLCGENKHCAYRRCSDRKWGAYENCIKMMDELRGFRFRFIGINSMKFSCGFVYIDNGEDKFMYITPSYNRAYSIKELTNENN